MGFGTIFKLTPSGDFSVIYNFVSTDGANPNELLEAADGSFYGTVGQSTLSHYVNGTVFHVTSDGDYTVLYAFYQDLIGPSGGLILASNGNFYGLSAFGGSTYYGGGAYTIDATGHFAIVHEFGGGVAGFNPNGRLLEALDGKLVRGNKQWWWRRPTGHYLQNCARWNLYKSPQLCFPRGL